MKLSCRIGLLATLVLATGACEAEYAYVPVTSATVITGHAGARYPIPSVAPHGDVRIASYGIVDVGSPTDEGDRMRAIHLRMTLVNDGEHAWTVDTREQRLELEGWGASAPAFASANAGSPPPNVLVPAMSKRVVDLFFPLPTALQKTNELPGFDAVWRVQAERDVEKRTPFERMAVEPPRAFDGPSDYGSGYYWGPPYWYNPAYGDGGFRGAAVIPPRLFGHPLYARVATQPPRFIARSSRR